jgi:hypothetical protein
MATVPIDYDIVAPFGTLPGTGELASIVPQWDSDMEWLSPATPEMHARFDAAFRKTGIGDSFRQYVDVEKDVRLYAGFLVVRSSCTATNFHVDWDQANNEAFTLLTPISDNGGDFGLLFRRLTGEIAEYSYKRGEAIVFGDKFWHSTKPGKSSEPVVLLCFEFGTDKMEHWESISRTIGHQAAYLCRPDGKFGPSEQAARSSY